MLGAAISNNGLLASVVIHEVLPWKLYDYSALVDAFVLMRNGV